MMILVTIAIILFAYALSWVITSGILWLICRLVGWTFSWKIATAIWLASCIVKFLFDKGSNG